MDDINFVSELVPLRIQKELREAGGSLSKSQWTIGKLANETMVHVSNEQKKGRFKDLFQYHVWIAVSQYCGLSFRRVEKLALVAEKFSPEVQEAYSEWDFGYFEKIYELPDEQKMQALEFLPFYYEEYGRKPKITDFKFLFRKHIMGEDVELAMPADFADIGYEEISESQPMNYWDMFASSLQNIKMVLENKPEKSDSVRRLVVALKVVEETLPLVMQEISTPIDISQKAKV